MKLFEMKKLPSAFGKAKIEYIVDRSTPTRSGDVITIPNNGYTDLYPLESFNRTQFILTIGDNYWFGGTDENPFLVQLNRLPINAFLEGGALREARFYSMLRWKEVGDLEAATKRRYRRQGDIFAVPLNMSWTSLLHCFKVAAYSMAPVHVSEAAVFGTRHMLSGAVLYGNPLRVYGIGTRLIASGIIVAPDHTDLNLGDKPHALYQTASLLRPEEAD